LERFAASRHEPGSGLLADLPYHPTAKVSRARSNYIARHWRGELSLPVSYWVNGWLLSTGYIVGTFFIVDDPAPSVTYAVGSLIVGALGFALQVWQLIGLWRSGDKHIERGGRPICAYLAKACVVFGWLSFVRGIVELFGGVPGN
jgi:hypothetical protein